MLIVLAIALIAAPWFLEVEPNRQSLRDAFAAPGADFLLGTDQYGRSILARLLEGGRYSLMLSVTIVGLCMATGLALAGLAAWCGGAWDTALTAFADGVYAIPGLLLVLIIAGLFGGSVSVLVGAMWFASWPEYYRLSRGVLRSVAASDHVLASRMLNVPLYMVMWYQMLPRAVPYAAGIGSLALGRTILVIASLGFLGIGIAPPQAELGGMVSELLPYLDKAHVQISAVVVVMVWSVTTFLLLGQGLTASVGLNSRLDA